MKKREGSFIIAASMAAVLTITATAVWFSKSVWLSEYGAAIRWQTAMDHRTYVENFDQYYNNFQVIAKLTLNHKEELEKSRYPFLSVYNGAGGPGISDPNQKNRALVLSRQEQAGLDGVLKSFRLAGGKLSRLEIYKNRVQFEIDNDRFAVVYAPDGVRPGALGYSDDKKFTYYVKELRPNWYQVTGTGK